MNTTTIIVIALVIAVTIAKFYNMFATVRNKGVKGFLTQKLTMLAVVAVVLGTFMLINPDFKFENPKKIITAYVYKTLDNKGEEQ